MKRGEIWTVSGSGEYTNKPRPSVILQAVDFSVTESVVVSVLTSDLTIMTPHRVRINPDNQNGLQSPSLVMVDKIRAVKKSRFGKKIGDMSPSDLAEVNKILALLLGMVGGRYSSTY
ncbi:MAG: type II toxin-antitoxin system PemK/MazF family toxin [Candidatus Symbiobacter sp.]|nr:type II toxin-antitoxin system PemK/MazF family toxin [Candidatus Symbiobacter sp.]